MYQTIKNMSTFTINERFDFLTAMVSMVAKGKTPSAIITGAGGLGKTFTVQQTLKSLNLKNVSNVDDFDDSYELSNAHKCYRFIKGYSTAKALYKTLYKNNGAERYPEFKLYKMIARHVHNHTPHAQLERKEFMNFEISKKNIKSMDTVMNIDEIHSM